ncbi:hypothetical protein [Ktedonospora formicarum]|uniref:DUF2029 domain-containing protein n=1 Tax=Ktedonospora formicarum TaxID=2778364 RepID=A0A8J3I275_9CHLR|nr:hypothetical protein [Ktedonospora formicarum]GHO44703.1 hypothetical protein KSX_28660 [Ktedonospora formicarum]
MKRIITHLQAYKLIYIGAFIHILFYLSASQTGWLNGLFTGDSLHYCCRGMDFYQVPDGAYAFWHGGNLTGAPLPNGVIYAQNHTVNSNVYHPLFTLTLGSWLILFQPEQTFYVWMLCKLLITAFVIGYFLWTFRESPYLGFATFILLANCTQYQEIAIGQFQFVLNIFLLLLLINLARGKHTVRSGFLYYLTLLAKPIGLLWLPLFVTKKRLRIALLGFGFFAFSTLVFQVGSLGNYYIDNLSFHLFSPGDYGPDQITTLASLLSYTTHWPKMILQGLQYLFLASVLLLGALRRVHISKGIFLMVVYYLFFYDFVYEYHYTTLAPVLAICFLCCPEFRTYTSRCLILWTCLPSAFVLLNYFHIGTYWDNMYGANVTPLGWQLMLVSRLLPILLLTINVVRPDIVPAYRQVKAFWLAMRKVNDHLEVFGI